MLIHQPGLDVDSQKGGHFQYQLQYSSKIKKTLSMDVNVLFDDDLAFQKT